VTDHLETGRKGEELAAEYLRQKLYTILERNWRHGRCEVDIIARAGDEVVFVEVKTRTSGDFGLPEEGVDAAKQRQLVKAAEAYRDVHGWTGSLRFDVIAIDRSHKRPVIEHFEDAFYPMK
jgi:putative endonuclease